MGKLHKWHRPEPSNSHYHYLIYLCDLRRWVCSLHCLLLICLLPPYKCSLISTLCRQILSLGRLQKKYVKFSLKGIGTHNYCLQNKVKVVEFETTLFIRGQRINILPHLVAQFTLVWCRKGSYLGSIFCLIQSSLYTSMLLCRNDVRWIGPNNLIQSKPWQRFEGKNHLGLFPSAW